jgi:sec-independent protein translocase protein TatA
MNLGPLEIGLIVLLIVLLFGAKRLPALGRSLGEGMREFKTSITGKSGSGDAPAELDSPEDPEAPDGDSPSRS